MAGRERLILLGFTIARWRVQVSKGESPPICRQSKRSLHERFFSTGRPVCSRSWQGSGPGPVSRHVGVCVVSWAVAGGPAQAREGERESEQVRVAWAGVASAFAFGRWRKGLESAALPKLVRPHPLAQLDRTCAHFRKLAQPRAPPSDREVPPGVAPPMRKRYVEML